MTSSLEDGVAAGENSCPFRTHEWEEHQVTCEIVDARDVRNICCWIDERDIPAGPNSRYNFRSTRIGAWTIPITKSPLSAESLEWSCPGWWTRG